MLPVSQTRLLYTLTPARNTATLKNFNSHMLLEDVSLSIDVDEMMKNYREKALAQRTMFQRFVDVFTMVPMPIYFILMFIGSFLTRAKLDSLDLALRCFTLFSGSDLLSGFQQGVLIHLWFIPPMPAMWNPSLATPGAVSVVVGFALFAVYFVSRRVAYGETYYLDLGFLAFFLLGLTLMFVSPSLFATLYYYYPASLVFTLLAVPALVTTVARRPFTLQHVERIYPPSIRALDIYKRIHYFIAAFFCLVFVISAAVFYFRFLVSTSSPVFTILFFMPFYFLILAWAFMTHFPGWYRRRVLKTPLKRESAPPPILRVAGALLIIYGESTLIVGLILPASVAFAALAYVVAVILMVSGVGIILVRRWGWRLAVAGLLSHIALFWLAWIMVPYGLPEWLASLGNFLVTLSFYPPSDNILFLALLFSMGSSVFLCYLFPKRNYYLAG